MLVDFQMSEATGKAERDAVPELLDRARKRRFHPTTLGADKGYDTRDCVQDMRERKVTPHVAQNTSGRRSAIDGRTTRRQGYRVSQRIRKRVEEIFGWMKTVGGFRRTRYRGLDRTGLAGYLVGTAYNFRIRYLGGQQLRGPPDAAVRQVRRLRRRVDFRAWRGCPGVYDWNGRVGSRAVRGWRRWHHLVRMARLIMKPPRIAAAAV